MLWFARPRAYAASLPEAMSIPSINFPMLQAVPARMPACVPSTFTSCCFTMMFVLGSTSGIKVRAVSVFMVPAGR